MRKKIITGLAIYAVLSALVGIYIIISIEKAASSLDNLIKLHQVEILREHLLIAVTDVQTDMTLKDTPYAKSADIIVSNTIKMDKLVDRCFGCHHSETVKERLSAMRDRASRYKTSLSRVLTISANRKRLEAEKNVAFHAGEDLLKMVNGMVAFTSGNLSRNTRAALDRISLTKVMLFVLIALGPLLTAGVAYVSLRNLTKPVNELLEATGKIEKGDLDYRITGLKDEFGELASSFNKMAGSLKGQMARVQKAEQMAVAGELSAGLAHEIKNPLAGIKVAMEVLSGELDLMSEDQAVLHKVTDEVRRLEVLMKSFLSFANPPCLRFDEVDVNRIVEGIVSFHLRDRQAASGEKGVAVVKSFDDAIPPIQADPMHLQQVILNVLLNALDAMPDGGVLTVRTALAPESNGVEIKISDNGRGLGNIAPEKIFQPFFTTKRKGTGLGLAISRQLIERHGGTISAEENPGGGALFRIVLPLDGGAESRTA